MKKILSSELIRRLDYSNGQEAFVNKGTNVPMDSGFRALMSEVVALDEIRRNKFKSKTTK